MKKYFVLALLFTLSHNVLAENNKNTADSANTRIDNSEKTTLKLSDDIGKMAGQIDKMGNKIIKTQEIQNENYNNTLNKTKK